jgi:tetratricopeptide (TPR) repeat protein
MAGPDENPDAENGRWDGTRSELSGSAGDVVQARDVGGGVHFHRAESTPGPLPRQLPAAIRDFTGRSADLAALDALLPADSGHHTGLAQPGAVVISAIDGAAGIGKTTLAVYWAHRVRERFPDGTLYANLRGYGPGRPASPGEALDSFLRALDIPAGRIPLGTEERAALYRSLLDGRRVLVVLDNANAPEQVRPLLPASETCLALVTSRSSLTGLVIGQGAERISLDLLPLGEAVVLLRGIVGAARANVEPQAVVDIALACARLPLALRIAGQRAAARPHLRLADIVTELADQRRRLDVLSASGDEATTVRAVFAWSYRGLPPRQQLVFRRLGLHPGTDISVHAAAALVDTAPAQTRQALEALADVHLVEEADRDRYQTHDLLRAYAFEQAGDQDTPEDRHAARRRLLGFYLHSIDAADRLIVRRRVTVDATPPPHHPLVFTTEQEALDWVQNEYLNLIAVARNAAEEGLYDLAWQIPSAMGGWFDRFAHRNEWLATCQAGLTAARSLRDRRGQRIMLLHLTNVLAQLRRFDDAVDCGRQAVDIARDIGDSTDEASSLDYLGTAYSASRQFEGAVDCYQQSLQTFREVGDAWGAAIVLNHLGETYQNLRRFDNAIDCHQQALPVFRESQDLSRKGWTLRLLGDTHRALDRFDVAIAYQTQALEVLRRRNYWQEIARTLESLGITLNAIGDHQAAQDYWREALAIFEQIGDPQANDIRTRLRVGLDVAPVSGLDESDAAY